MRSRGPALKTPAPAPNTEIGEFMMEKPTKDRRENRVVRREPEFSEKMELEASRKMKS